MSRHRILGAFLIALGIVLVAFSLQGAPLWVEGLTLLAAAIALPLVVRAVLER